jgi:hypothetical protein
MQQSNDCHGLGDKHATLKVYIGNRPNFTFALDSNSTCPAVADEINAIGNACGNGWRKVFNVYAKLMFELPRKKFPMQMRHMSWQQYRDNELLRSLSSTALMFSPPIVDDTAPAHLSIIMGRTYAKSLILPTSMVWKTEAFAIDIEHKLIICPYFDYRQLSNMKISYLVKLMNSLQ